MSQCLELEDWLLQDFHQIQINTFPLSRRLLHGSDNGISFSMRDDERQTNIDAARSHKYRLMADSVTAALDYCSVVKINHKNQRVLNAHWPSEAPHYISWCDRPLAGSPSHRSDYSSRSIGNLQTYLKTLVDSWFTENKLLFVNIQRILRFWLPIDLHTLNQMTDCVLLFLIGLLKWASSNNSEDLRIVIK